MQNGENSTKKIPKNIFFKNSKTILKNQNFRFLRKKSRKSKKKWFFGIFIEFSKKMFSGFFGRISPILHDRSPRLSELFSKLEWYFCSRFFCATRYRLVVYGKNCLGRRGARSAPVVEQITFSSRIFPNPRSTYLESVRYGNQNVRHVTRNWLVQQSILL